MKKINLLSVIFLAATLFTACDKNNGNEPVICPIETVDIEDISFENYPTVDCSTSARAVSVAAACKLLSKLAEIRKMVAVL
jgi:hypothetical protein